jgi:predicted Zn finger-like uncharacterized protein
MSANEKIKTRCPVCRSAYRVPDSSVGHRARCPKCDSVFRVSLQVVNKPAEPSQPHKPTEEEILGWLTAGDEPDDVPPEPKRWQMASPGPALPPQMDQSHPLRKTAS